MMKDNVREIITEFLKDKIDDAEEIVNECGKTLDLTNYLSQERGIAEGLVGLGFKIPDADEVSKRMRENQETIETCKMMLRAIEHQ